MWRAFYAGMSTEAPLLAFGVFAVLFLTVVLRAFVVRRSDDFDAVAALPLEPEQEARR